MTRLDDFPAPDTGPAGSGLSLRDRLRLRRAAVRLRSTALWPEIQAFGQWLESQCFPAAANAGLKQVLLEVEPSGRVNAFGFTPPAAPDGLRRLAAFLTAICVRQLQLDRRLQGRQLGDVMALLYAHRRALTDRSESSADAGGLSGLWGQAGLDFACTRTLILADRLVVSYQYRPTRLSRLVRRFERRYRRVQDHRALFRAAPRYALLPAAIAVALAASCALAQSWWVRAAAVVLAAAALSALAYLFFMTVGGVERDNEEKARRLGETCLDLKHSADSIQADLRRARDVQQKMLPELANMPLAERLHWAASFAPAQQVGGDYFDVLALDDHRAAILFADVSGHGLAAAFITAILKTSFQAWADHPGPLGEFLSTVNRTLCRLTPDDSFAAAFAAIYDADSRRLSYVNCGHNPEPWLLYARADQPLSQLDDARAILLGVVDDPRFRQASRQLQPGDTVLLATDGLVEAGNIYDKMYGQENLEDFLRRHRGMPVSELVELLTREVTGFARGGEQTDDRTVLAFQLR